MRIYLDACCLSRPFDDQSLDRNRLEGEAVLTILRRIDRREWKMVGSDALDKAKLRVRVANPLAWMKEQVVDEHGGNDIE